MKSLRKGDRGPEVLKLQENLIQAGYPLKADAIFWDATDTAVRNFQRKNNLIADGVVGEKTLKALKFTVSGESKTTTASTLNDLMAILGAKSTLMMAAAQLLAPVHVSSRPASQLSTSHKGLLFIYSIEAYPGISNYLHWPGGASGVTLGPGYDMKMRTEADIIRDFIAIGVEISVAGKISKAAGLQGEAAKKFCKENKTLASLKREEEFRLLKQIIPKYEVMVKKRVTIDLLQHEFDALVCFAYNPGGQFNVVCNSLNQKNIADAMKKIKRIVKSGGKSLPGLVTRREREISLYVNGDYGKLREV